MDVSLPPSPSLSPLNPALHSCSAPATVHDSALILAVLHLHGEEEAGVSNNHYASSSSPPDRWPGPAEAGERAPLLLHDNSDISDDTAHQISAGNRSSLPVADPWYQANMRNGLCCRSLVPSWVRPGDGGEQRLRPGIPWVSDGSSRLGLGDTWLGSCRCDIAVRECSSCSASSSWWQETHQIQRPCNRDLAGYIYGRKMYALTWALQYIYLFFITTGFIILAGQSLKATYALFRDDGALKLPYCIAISGFVCALFAFGIPYLSALKIWLGFSTVLSLIYTMVAVVLSLRNGITTPARDYSIPRSQSTRVYSTIGAVANLLFVYNTGMLPEIQATLRPPVIKNVKKALWFQFTIGSLPLYAVVFMGYWAYGSSTSSYLLNNIKGPVWISAVANMSAFLQTIISLHIFAIPMYEFLDTKYGSGEGGPFAIHNIMFRVLARGSYLAINTLVAAMLPFLGDFMGLTGALCTIPLTLILANHMHLVVKRNKLSPIQKLWHWLNVVGFSVFAVVATVAALRLIMHDSSTYHFFADM